MGRRSEWKSHWDYDREAKRFIIEGTKGKYVAFWYYNASVLDPEWPAGANGNVIAINPNIAPAFFRTLFEHEVQHVIQEYEIEDFDTKYKANRLFYEKEACARQLIAVPVTDKIRDGIFDNLVKNGMEDVEALHWIDKVESSGEYPGVNLPRLKEQ